MAWNTPITWADGDVPTAPQFNQQFRDNFNELALHAHSGGSGSGADTLGGPTGLQHIFFHDIAAPGTPGGTVNALFATAGTFGWVNSNGTVFLAANSTHEHTGSWVQPTAAASTGDIVSASLSTVWLTGWTATNAAAFVNVATSDHTVGGTGSRALLLSAYFHVSNQTAVNRAFTLIGSFEFNGTGATAFGGVIQATLTGSYAQQYVIHAPLTGQPSGSYHVTAAIKAAVSTSNQPIIVYATALLHEFQIK